MKWKKKNYRRSKRRSRGSKRYARKYRKTWRKKGPYRRVVANRRRLPRLSNKSPGPEKKWLTYGRTINPVAAQLTWYTIYSTAGNLLDTQSGPGPFYYNGFPAEGVDNGNRVGLSIRYCGMDLRFSIYMNSPDVTQSEFRIIMVKTKQLDVGVNSLPVVFNEPVNAKFWTVISDKVYPYCTGMSTSSLTTLEFKPFNFRFWIPFMITLSANPSSVHPVWEFNYYIYIMDHYSTKLLILDTFCKIYFMDT